MSTPQPPGSDDLLRREAAVRWREELLAARESVLDAMIGFRQSQSDALETQLRDGRDINEQLVVTSIRQRKLADAAERANLRKDECLAMLSHELRNPLASMQNVVGILGRLSAAEPRLPWIHDVLARQLGQLTRLLDDLLDAARVRTGQIVLKKQRLLARTFFEQAVETCSPLAEARGQQLSATLPDGPAWVDGDAVRLTQVFTNLLNNAIKYTPRGGRIGLSVECSDAVLVARVTDNGCGLAAETLPRIFDLFMQEDQSLAHSQGGLGIGLAVVKELVQLHGGTVVAASPGRGQGCEFTVRLPLLPEGEGGDAASSRAPDESARPAAHPLSIALIEDNVDANQSLATLLQMAGHEVASAYDGPAGVSLVLALRPQVVLCDLGLPGLDGLGVAARLRASISGPQPTLVALTGYGAIEDISRSKAAGFDAHLVKPVQTRALLALLDREADRLGASMRGPSGNSTTVLFWCFAA